MNLSELDNKHSGCVAYIVGKGPSLDQLEEIRDDLDQPGVVILAINESIHKVESLMLNVPLYVVQQDSGLEFDCIPSGKKTVHLMNSLQHKMGDAHSTRNKVAISPWNSKAVLYDEGPEQLTAVIALKLALRMGIQGVTFVCFDALSASNDCSYAHVIGKDSGAVAGPGRHMPNGAHILEVARQLMQHVDVKFPEIKSRRGDTSNKTVG